MPPIILEVQSTTLTLEIASSPVIMVDVGVGYVHTQSSASTTWTVNHNLGYYPNVSVLSPARQLMLATIAHTNINQFLVSFNEEQTGTVIAR